MQTPPGGWLQYSAPHLIKLSPFGFPNGQLHSWSFCVQVVAVDQASRGLSATAQLNISILDYNDNAPQFPTIPDPVQVAEGPYTEEKPGHILTIVPTDADLGPSGEVTLSISPPHPLFRFREVRLTERTVGIVGHSAFSVL